MTQPDTDTRIDDILSRFERSTKYTHDNTANIAYFKARQSIKDLIAEQVAAARVGELRRFPLINELGSPVAKKVAEEIDAYIARRMAELKKGQK